MKKKFVVKINELCQSKGISLKDLSKMTEIQYEALYNLANYKTEDLDLQYVARIADVLNITDVREIIDLVDELT